MELYTIENINKSYKKFDKYYRKNPNEFIDDMKARDYLADYFNNNHTLYCKIIPTLLYLKLATASKQIGKMLKVINKYQKGAN